MSEILEDQFREHGADVTVIRVGLLPEHIRAYTLPSNPSKKADSRTKAFEARFGLESTELDALRPDVLEAMIRVAVEGEIDRDAWAAVELVEQAERDSLGELAAYFRRVDPEEARRDVGKLLGESGRRSRRANGGAR